MTHHEAQIIFKDWRGFVEINDKLATLFSSLPQSLLPYPPEVIEEALNIIAEDYFNAGKKEMSQTVQASIGTLVYYTDDKDALEDMYTKLKLMKESPELEEVVLQSLERVRKSWKDSRDRLS